VIFNYTPIGMSADGRWVYAASLYGIEPQLRPAYRVSIETGDPEPIDEFPTSGPSRIVSTAIDPISGRLLLAGPHTTSDPGFVQAWTTGATTPDFQAKLGIVFSAAWTDDGGVIAADYDQLPGPFHFRVLSLDETGRVARTYFTAEGTNAAMVGLHNGFAAAYVAATGSNARTLVVIRLSDGATSAVEVADPAGLSPYTVGIRP
jgi:hypothetical protein